MFKKMISIVAVAGLVLTLAPAANAAISVANSIGSAIEGSSGVYVAGDTVTHTLADFAIADHDNDMLVVMIGNMGGEEGGDGIASLTFGGVDMTLQTEHNQTSGWYTNGYIYTLEAPDVGTDDHIVIVWDTATSNSNRIDKKSMLLSTLHVYGDQPLSIVEEESGYFDDSGTWAEFDEATEAFYYAGVHSRRDSHVGDTFEWAGTDTADFDASGTPWSLVSRARGHYFSDGTAGSLAVDGDVYGGSTSKGDGYARIAIQEVPEPATMSLLAIGGLGVMLKRRRRRA